MAAHTVSLYRHAPSLLSFITFVTSTPICIFSSFTSFAGNGLRSSGASAGCSRSTERGPGFDCTRIGLACTSGLFILGYAFTFAVVLNEFLRLPGV
jgi:hypothetical protein